MMTKLRIPISTAHRRLRALAYSIALMVALGFRADAMATSDAGSDAGVAVEVAQRLFREGREAFVRGDYRVACEKLEASNELVVTSGTLVNLALCEERLGHLASAWMHLQAFADRADPNDDRRPTAEALFATLRPRMPHLLVSIDAPRPSDARVLLDGHPLSAEQLDTDLLVDPGEHQVALLLQDNAVEQKTVTLAEGGRECIRFYRASSMPSRLSARPLVTSIPPSAASGLTTAPPMSGPAEPPNRERGVAWAIGGVALASLIASATAGALALERVSTVERECPGMTCSDEGWRAASAARTLALVSDITLVAGLIGAGTAFYVWSSGSHGASSVTLGVQVGPHYNSLAWGYQH